MLIRKENIMNNKKRGNILYGIVVLLLLVAVIFVVVSKDTQNSNAVVSDNVETVKVPVKVADSSLDKYRQAPIPEDCRLADYDNDVKAWAEHLSHHGNTKYCLEYYEGLY